MRTNSEKLFHQAQQVIPGGVNSPVRAFKSVGMNPLYITRGKGSKIYDADGNEYIDFVGSWGPLILGHADDRILKVINETAANGISFGACTESEIKLASLINEVYPSMEMIRMVSSGTEATMSAIRLARGFTGKDKIIKFEGCYHGHADSFLIKAGSGVLTLGIPGTPGITKNTAQDTLLAIYNDIESVDQIIQANKGQIAAIIIEPVMGNAGVILPQNDFLKKLRDITTANNILLIFDEVITGFRVALGGAQEVYKVKPDLTCLGKIIGGGLPVAAFGGRRDIMEYLAPVGPVYQAGTLSGNPIAMAVGFETISILKEKDIYIQLGKKAEILEQGLKQAMQKAGKHFTINRIGSMSTLFFTSEKVENFESAMKADIAKYSDFFKKMLAQGIYLAPSQFEAAFISTAHSDGDLNRTIDAVSRSLE